MRADLPVGTVSFLFTDVEGSTTLLNELGPADYADALADHRRVLREAFGAHGGVEVDTQGDAIFVAFPTAPGAIEAAAAATQRHRSSSRIPGHAAPTRAYESRHRRRRQPVRSPRRTRTPQNSGANNPCPVDRPHSI